MQYDNVVLNLESFSWLLTATNNDGWVNPHPSGDENYPTVNCGVKPNPTSSCNGKYCLFNLADDPCEYNDLSRTSRGQLRKLKKRLQFYRNTMVPSVEEDPDTNANPAFNGDNAWVPWL